MDLDKLHTELTTDPLSRGYSGMADAAAAASLNTANRTRNRGIIETWRLFERLVQTEYLAAMTDATDGTRNRHLIEVLLGMGTVNVNSPNVATVLVAVFGNGSETIKNLTGNATAADPTWRGDDIRSSKVSRADELGVGFVEVRDVRDARTIQ